jgi:hypothetical protein
LIGRGLIDRTDAEIDLTNHQLKFVTAICQPLPVEKRSVFLNRMVAHLQIRDLLRHPSDHDLEVACRAALHNLAHGSAAA